MFIAAIPALLFTCLQNCNEFFFSDKKRQKRKSLVYQIPHMTMLMMTIPMITLQQNQKSQWKSKTFQK